jgi:hypothetical protein
VWIQVNRAYWAEVNEYFNELSEQRMQKMTNNQINNNLSNHSSPKTKGFAGVLLFVEVSRLTLGTIVNTQIHHDFDLVNVHLQIMSKAMNDVSRAVNDGNIPEDYLTNIALGSITNYVLQGVNNSNDPKIEEIGEMIIECYSDCEKK